jgi:hypothetical protein
MNTSPVQPPTSNRWGARLKNFLKLAAYPLCFLLGLQFYPAYELLSILAKPRRLQTVVASGGKHTAELYKKHNLADINFIVSVDGQRVYVSSDLNGFLDGEYRETLLWDKTGTVVVLELMGKHVFAFNAETKQTLKKGELQSYKLYPLLSDVQYAPIKDIDE